MENLLEPYLNQITCGNCIPLTGNLPDDSVDAVLIDPPYGESQEYQGDDDIKVAKIGLRNFLSSVKPKLKQNGHLGVFWTMRNVDVCIEEVKSLFTFRRVVVMYVAKGNARPYLGWLPRTQAIVIGQKYVPGQPSDFHYELSAYLNQKLNESQYTRSSISKLLGCDSRLVMKWTRPGDPSWCLPTPRFYLKLKELLNLDDQYDFLLERQDCSRKSGRNDLIYKHDCYIVKNEKGKMLHPAMKPLEVVEHVVSCICPEGGVVLDGFCGSGTTCVAARNTNRNFIGFEISEKYCEIARGRLND